MVWVQAGHVVLTTQHTQLGTSPSPDQTFLLAEARGQDRQRDTQLVEDKCVNAATETDAGKTGLAADKHLNCPCSEALPICKQARKKKKTAKEEWKTTQFRTGQGKIQSSSHNEKVQPQERIKGQMHRMWLMTKTRWNVPINWSNTWPCSFRSEK